MSVGLTDGWDMEEALEDAVAIAERLREPLTLVLATWSLETFLPLLTGNESENLPQSEASAEGVLVQINKMYNNKQHKKQMVLTQEFSKLLLNY